MSWTRFFFHDYFTAQELNKLDRRLKQQRQLRSASSRELRDRVETLEDENARLALMLQALTECCVRKGVVTREELQRMVSEVDLWDGKQDGKLSRPPERDDSKPKGPIEFLGDLERRDQ
jgi:hypothetical protein